MGGERLLVNFFYAAVGHAVEALHYCLGHHAADPHRAVSLVLNASSVNELASSCPFIEDVYPITHPFVEACGDAEARLRALPREWDWVLDDVRRRQDIQIETFPGMGDFYAASDHHLIARRGRSVVGATPPGYVPRCRLRFQLPDEVRARAARRLGPERDRAPVIAVMPAGSSKRCGRTAGG